MDFGNFIVLINDERRQANLTTLRNRRQLRDASNPFDLEDYQFQQLFRINKEIALALVHGLESDLRRSRRNGLPLHIIVPSAVRFYATGSYQRCVGQEYNLALAQRTVSQIIQQVCDVNCKLLNVNARYPGSTHDQHIFNNSNVFEMERLTNARIGKYFLIGDSGYSKEAFLITPILPSPPVGSPEHRYNMKMKLTQVRNCVERTNGIIKAVFRCLRKDRVLHYQPKTAAYIILSCCTIYNMMHHFRFSLPDVEDANENVDSMADSR